MEKLHKVGKYGTEETCKDEKNSKECASEIYEHLCAYYPIEGWTYEIFEKGFPVSMYYEREGYIKESKESGNTKIKPDISTIIIREDKNKNNFYVVLCGDDKYQKTSGNAIERALKNLNVCEKHMCCNSEINPYVIFICGKGFFNDDGSYNDYLFKKLKQMFELSWSINDKHNSLKRKWNQIYLQKERFTKEQKMEILKSVAIESVKYYKSILEK